MRSPGKYDGCEYITPSGRRWRARHEHSRVYILTPLGYDTHGFGGVKAKRVVEERLDGTDKIWRPV